MLFTEAFQKRVKDTPDSNTYSPSSYVHIDTEAKQPPCIKKDGSFKDLVTQSTIFADKSLFIKTAIEDTSTGLLVAMPRRWGKTVNLIIISCLQVVKLMEVCVERFLSLL